MKSAQLIWPVKSVMKKKDKHNCGFTLLELLISLTIVAVIVVLIFSALRIGVRAWEKGEENVEARQRYRIVLNLMRQQLAAVCLSVSGTGENRSVLFKGDEGFVEFISRRSLMPDSTAGIVYIRYQTESDKNSVRLSLYEKNMVVLKNVADMEVPAPDDYYELIRDMADFGFEYLKESADDKSGEIKMEWQPAWDLEKDKGFPRAVRIRFRSDKASAAVYVIVPIRGGSLPSQEVFGGLN
ncbi:MAG: type II secretion system protein J [Desulfococcaceae bacterium]